MKTIVLRDLGNAGGLGLPTTRGGSGPTDLAGADLRIEIEDTDDGGRAELTRDRQVVAVCAAMPMALIRPLAASDSEEAAGPAWGVGAVGASDSSWTGNGTTVAVLDTGVDADHPAFAGVEVVERDFSGTGIGDRNGHGTHCAGTILGRDVDGVRIGVARGVGRLLAGKILADGGGGSSEMAFAGIRWAAEQGADVISMSVGWDFPGFVVARVDAGWPVDLATSSALEAYRGNVRVFDALMAYLRAQEHFSPGAVVVAAAGNESKRQISDEYEIGASLPAAADGVISVGAVQPGADGYGIAPFSNTFPTVCAPGVDIVSAATGGGLVALSGTSMACPHVAGVAALWWESIRAAGIPAVARSVSARLQATARSDVFASGVSIAARGNGLVSAPPA